jgi:diadenosine tetraphosphate (Ap4A) HIT family hydrolase
MTPACPFCELKGERIIRHSGLSLAIRDNYPVSDGHTLILPRRYLEA